MKLTKLILLGIAGASLVFLPRRSSKSVKPSKPTPTSNESPTKSDDKDKD